MLTALAAAQLLFGVDYNIVFVALPRIASLGFFEGAWPRPQLAGNLRVRKWFGVRAVTLLAWHD